jgi:hypothetical protein
MKVVKAKFIHDEQVNHHAARYANGKPQHINQRKHLALQQVAPCNGKIVFYHIVSSFQFTISSLCE